MLKEERQRQILAMLTSNGRVVAAQLSNALGTSEDTIRRDLRELAEAGLLQRVHGGALQRTTTPLSHSARAQKSPRAKAVLADACLPMLRNGQVVILDGGTTVEQVAHHLPTHLKASVITNSVTVVLALSRHPYIEIIVPGGRFFKEAQVLVGATTVNFYSSVRADVCLMGVGSVHPHFGVSVLDFEEAQVKKAMLGAATETIVLADADKLGKAAPFQVAALSSVACLVTERAVGDAALQPYRDLTRVIAV